MSFNADIENRLLAAFIALIQGEKPISDAVSGRVRKFGSQAAKAEYPCVLVQVANVFPFDATVGWYRASVTVYAATHIAADNDKSLMMQLAGLIRGLIQSGRVDKDLNQTAPARNRDTCLTAVDVEIADSFEEEDGNVRRLGIMSTVVCRPSIGMNQG
jgi:hypothetical protein